MKLFSIEGSFSKFQILIRWILTYQLQCTLNLRNINNFVRELLFYASYCVNRECCSIWNRYNTTSVFKNLVKSISKTNKTLWWWKNIFVVLTIYKTLIIKKLRIHTMKWEARRRTDSFALWRSTTFGDFFKNSSEGVTVKGKFSTVDLRNTPCIVAYIQSALFSFHLKSYDHNVLSLRVILSFRLFYINLLEIETSIKFGWPCEQWVIISAKYPRSFENCKRFPKSLLETNRRKLSTAYSNVSLNNIKLISLI